MNNSNKIHQINSGETYLKQQEREVSYYNKNKKRIEKIKISFTFDHKINFLDGREILRIVQNNDVFENLKLFKNLDQIKHLTWLGQYNQTKKKDGKWVALWDYNSIRHAGGYYKDGQKQGLWKDLFQNYCDDAKIFETGEYYNDLRNGKWNYICNYMKFGGGYNKDGKKQGKWIELDEDYYSEKKVTYRGEYNLNGMKIGLWDILHLKRWEYEYKQIGGGTYDYEGYQYKIGKWVELDEEFHINKQVTYIGQYNMNGMKVGKWDIFYDLNGDGICKQIGGGTFDQEGNQNKIGEWVELDKEFSRNKQVTYNGEYNMNGMKVGRWDLKICKYNEKEYKQIGGGVYDYNGDLKKIGRWVELDEKFSYDKQITYNGEYNMNGMKIGLWNIMFCRFDDNEYKLIGGGIFDQEGNQNKIGEWVELDEEYYRDKQVTYKGQYNTKGMKVGKWDISNLGYQNKLCGCINFDENGNEIYKSQNTSILYIGSFNNRMKVGRWDVMKEQNGQYKQIGGGFYDQEGNEKKIGQWIELNEGFRDDKQVSYYGEYNKNGKKVGRWKIMFCKKKWIWDIKQIGGGSYDQEGIDKKTGKWVELDDEFYLNKQITYNGEYNINGMKVGKWDIMYDRKGDGIYKQIGGGMYDQEGNQKKIGKWVHLDQGFIYKGQYNLKGLKEGFWLKMSMEKNKILRKIKYENN